MYHNITSQKVLGSRPNEATEIFSIYLILAAAQGSGVYSASKEMSTRNRK
jgi:hypothetical protein